LPDHPDGEEFLIFSPMADLNPDFFTVMTILSTQIMSLSPNLPCFTIRGNRITLSLVPTASQQHPTSNPFEIAGRRRRHLSQGTDFYFKIDWNDVWPLQKHFEPVLIFVCLPYISHMPNFNGINSLLDRANYLSKRGPFAPCKDAWCGSCYGPRGSKPFLIRAQYDDDGDIIVEPGGIKFLEGRKGDHLMIPFQCDQCHFRNITGRDPVEWKITNHEVLEYIQRANLDTFWDRLPNTVSFDLSDA
jgi:hypothetical protein